MVSPATAVWPSKTSALVPSGRNTSSREPNRINPNRSPAPIDCPSRTKDTIRRATSPAIWMTPIRPFGVEMTSELRSLSSLALSSSALMKVPGRYAIRSIRPATGLRFTWQLNTLMKIETRGSGLLPNPRSAGGDTRVTTGITPPARAPPAPRHHPHGMRENQPPPDGHQGPEPAQRRPDPEQDQTHKCKAADEGIAF